MSNIIHENNLDKSIIDESIIDQSFIVKFRGEECTLGEAIVKCQPGETIEGAPVEWFDSLLNCFEKLRGKEYFYSTDRRYGKWRFILFGERDS